jgi:GTP1/Obg family GTP-binding protein
MNSVETVNKALEIARQRQRTATSFEMFSSIVAQLEYMERILSCEETDRSKMKEIIVGHYAARELEDSDPELANALFDVQAIASKMARGLKAG